MEECVRGFWWTLAMGSQRNRSRKASEGVSTPRVFDPWRKFWGIDTPPFARFICPVGDDSTASTSILGRTLPLGLAPPRLV